MPSLSALATLPFAGDDDPTDAPCRCQPSFETTAGASTSVELVVESRDCPGGGDLVTSPDCRETVVSALSTRDADAVRTRVAGRERSYDDHAAATLLAAGRFVERAAFHDETLADRARRDPLGAARDATGRAGPVSHIAAETGLAECAARADGYDDALPCTVAPTFAGARRDVRPPADATLVDRRDLDSGATVRRYETRAGPYYDLTPIEADLSNDEMATLAAAYETLATGGVSGGERAPGRAVRRVADERDPVETLTRVLRKHTRGHGVLDDVFADPRVSDVVVTAPVSENPVRVRVDDERVRTNLRLTRDGAAALASRFRRASGRAFSRANPTLDAVVDAPDGGRVRVAGVTAPASDGFGFAFRTHGDDAWTLPALVANGTMPLDAAALLSLAVERSAAGLVAGPRGAGKTTLLGALLWEVPASTRSVVVEDTPELPIAALRDAGRDVQALRTETSADDPSLSATEALRTALRLGDGALVVGEVRGEEAATLYEAMRVGANSGAVLGTIHGDGAEAVRERVVTDLGVPESSFAATDVVVSLAAGESRRIVAVDEVRRDADGVHFASLFTDEDGSLEPTGAIDRGDSRLVADLATPNESYADVRTRLDDREASLAELVRTGQTRVDDVEPTDRGWSA
jgi:type IV secretory pathway ATPase VirB11/archaellum biosynthesis ATPase